jgi:hypothetical protein
MKKIHGNPKKMKKKMMKVVTGTKLTWAYFQFDCSTFPPFFQVFYFLFSFIKKLWDCVRENRFLRFFRYATDSAPFDHAHFWLPPWNTREKELQAFLLGARTGPKKILPWRRSLGHKLSIEP